MLIIPQSFLGITYSTPADELFYLNTLMVHIQETIWSWKIFI